MGDDFVPPSAEMRVEDWAAAAARVGKMPKMTAAETVVHLIGSARTPEHVRKVADLVRVVDAHGGVARAVAARLDADDGPLWMRVARHVLCESTKDECVLPFVHALGVLLLTPSGELRCEPRAWGPALARLVLEHAVAREAVRRVQWRARGDGAVLAVLPDVLLHALHGGHARGAWGAVEVALRVLHAFQASGVSVPLPALASTAAALLGAPSAPGKAMRALAALLAACVDSRSACVAVLGQGGALDAALHVAPPARVHVAAMLGHVHGYMPATVAARVERTVGEWSRASPAVHAVWCASRGLTDELRAVAAAVARTRVVDEDAARGLAALVEQCAHRAVAEAWPLLRVCAVAAGGVDVLGACLRCAPETGAAVEPFLRDVCALLVQHGASSRVVKALARAATGATGPLLARKMLAESGVLSHVAAHIRATLNADALQLLCVLVASNRTRVLPPPLSPRAVLAAAHDAWHRSSTTSRTRVAALQTVYFATQSRVYAAALDPALPLVAAALQCAHAPCVVMALWMLRTWLEDSADRNLCHDTCAEHMVAAMVARDTLQHVLPLALHRHARVRRGATALLALATTLLHTHTADAGLFPAYVQQRVFAPLLDVVRAHPRVEHAAVRTLLALCSESRCVDAMLPLGLPRALADVQRPTRALTDLLTVVRQAGRERMEAAQRVQSALSAPPQ